MIKVIYEDNHIIVVDKGAGMLTQGDSSGKTSLYDLVKGYIRITRGKPGEVFLGLVHRLDRVVSGVMVFARTSKAARRLHEQLLHKRTIKMYLALVHTGSSLPEEWTTLEHTIRSDDGRSVITGENDTKGKKISLRYITLARNNTYALLCIHLITGKKHQIRIQLSESGLPIVGDGLYGSREKMSDAIFLHSYFLRIKHPTKDEFCEFFAKIPVMFHEKLNITPEIEKNIIDTIRDEVKKYSALTDS